MLRPLSLSKNELKEWREKSWQEYAAETRNNIRIKLQANFIGELRVLHGNKEI